MDVYLRNHLSENSISDEIKQRTSKLFLKAIDPLKIHFYKKDADQVERQIVALFEAVKDSDCSSLDSIQAALTTHTQETAQIMSEVLNAEFKLNPKESVDINSARSNYPEDTKQKKKALSSLSQLKVATLTMKGLDTARAAKEILGSYQQLASSVKALDQHKMIVTFVRAFVRALDPHSDYGISANTDEIQLEPNHAIGLKALETVTRETEPATIHYQTVRAATKAFKIGIIDLPGFYSLDEGRTTYEDVKRLLEEAKASQVDGLVLDLSRNGGGLLQVAVKVTSLFLGPLPIGMTQDRENKREILQVEKAPVEYAGPLVVLASRRTGSGSELVTGALKDYRRALVVGSEQTSGVGTIQILNALPLDLGWIKLTAQRFFTPSGDSPQKTGVKPHVMIPNLLDAGTTGEASLDNAISPSKIDSFLPTGKHPWNPVADQQILRIKAKSLKRTQADQSFKKIKKFLADQRSLEGKVTVAAILASKIQLEDTKLKEAPLREALDVLTDYLNETK